MKESLILRDDFKLASKSNDGFYQAGATEDQRGVPPSEATDYVKIWAVPNSQHAQERPRTISDSTGLSCQAISSLAHAVRPFWFKIANTLAQTF